MMLKARPLANSWSRAFFSVCDAGWLQPLAKAQDLALVLGQSRHARQRVRDDAHCLTLLPEDQDLRLGADDGVGGGEVAAQLLHLGLASRASLRGLNS